MTSINLICISAVILSGIIYGISTIVAKKGGFRGRTYEGEKAVSAGWTILLIFIVLAILFACGELMPEIASRSF